MVAQPNPYPEVRDHGQILEMALPADWIEAPEHKFSGGIGMRGLREIYPPDAPTVRLCFFYRGLPMNPQAGKQFFDVLQKPPHDINEEEWNSIGVLLRDRTDPADFTLFMARTCDWNGRRVLIVEGRYIGLQEDNLEIFVDADADGRTVQEIFYQAPKDLYNRYLRSAEAALKSIRWKADGEGESYETRFIWNADDLGNAWKDHGESVPLKVTMRINPAGMYFPTSEGDRLPGDSHTVSVTHIDFNPDGSPTQVYVVNPAGGVNRSYPNGSPIPAADFVRSTRAHVESGNGILNVSIEAQVRIHGKEAPGEAD